MYTLICHPCSKKLFSKEGKDWSWWGEEHGKCDACEKEADCLAVPTGLKWPYIDEKEGDIV